MTTSWFDEVKSAIGLEAVSQVWGEKPAWYFWIADTPGTYALQLEDINAPQPDRPDWVSGIFALKCYPYPHQNVFQSFSFQERSMILSDVFDDTHTPRFSHRDRIPDTLFNVATVELNVDRNGRWAQFIMEGLELMQISYVSEVIPNYPVLQKERRFKSGEFDRNVPGWELSYPLFDRLLSLYSFYSKKTPVRLWSTRSPGFSYVFDGDHARCVKAPKINLFSLSVLFGSRADDGIPEVNLIHRQSIADDQEVIYDRGFDCDHFHRDPEQPRHMPPLNEKWWSLAHSNYTSSLSSTCGCA